MVDLLRGGAVGVLDTANSPPFGFGAIVSAAQESGG
jgi:hypothetical protein